MSAIIETSGLTKVFGANGNAVHALRGIDMVVEKGEAREITSRQARWLVER